MHGYQLDIVGWKFLKTLPLGSIGSRVTRRRSGGYIDFLGRQHLPIYTVYAMPLHQLPWSIGSWYSGAFNSVARCYLFTRWYLVNFTNNWWIVVSVNITFVYQLRMIKASSGGVCAELRNRLCRLELFHKPIFLLNFRFRFRFIFNYLFFHFVSLF